jgi:hypothetical protein
MPSNAPKGKFHMSLLSKRLVSIAASTALLSLVSAAAHAQGTWYTNRTLWQSLVTNIAIAEYNGFETVPENNHYYDEGVDSTGMGVEQSIGNGYLTTLTGGSVRFDYSVQPFHAFCGEFKTSSNGFLDFRVYNFGSSTNYTYSLATSAGTDTFLGYISTSADLQEVHVEPIDTDYTLRVNSFNLGNQSFRSRLQRRA